MLSTHENHKGDLLVDNLDSQRPSRAYYAFDDCFHGGIPHLEALVLGFDLCDLIYSSHRHHARCLVAFAHKGF